MKIVILICIIGLLVLSGCVEKGTHDRSCAKSWAKVICNGMDEEFISISSTGFGKWDYFYCTGRKESLERTYNADWEYMTRYYFTPQEIGWCVE